MIFLQENWTKRFICFRPLEWCGKGLDGQVRVVSLPQQPLIYGCVRNVPVVPCEIGWFPIVALLFIASGAHGGGLLAS